MEYFLKKIVENTGNTFIFVFFSFLLNGAICINTCSNDDNSESIIKELRETNKKLDLILEQKK